MSEQGLMVLTTVVVALTNGLWYYAKYQLHREGLEVSWFTDHFRDLRLLRELARGTRSDLERRRFERLLLGLYLMLGLVSACFGILVLRFFSQS